MPYLTRLSTGIKSGGCVGAEIGNCGDIGDPSLTRHIVTAPYIYKIPAARHQHLLPSICSFLYSLRWLHRPSDILPNMPGAVAGPKTLYDKVFDAHIVDEKDDGTVLLYIGKQAPNSFAHECKD